MRTDPLSPEARRSQIAKTSESIRKKHLDPVWRAAWLEGNRRSLQRRKELVDRALKALADQEHSTS